MLFDDFIGWVFLSENNERLIEKKSDLLIDLKYLGLWNEMKKNQF